MINIKIVCVGNLKEKFWNDACDEYIKRLGRFCKVKVVELAEQNKYEQTERIVTEEGKEIVANLEGACCLLDINGKMITSEDLAAYISEKSLVASTLTFVIGGSYGVSTAVKEKIPSKISFGRVTYPHNLARVILLEQIYRAFMINGGGKYHK